jgi:hypothetical protein
VALWVVTFGYTYDMRDILADFGIINTLPKA